MSPCVLQYWATHEQLDIAGASMIIYSQRTVMALNRLHGCKRWFVHLVFPHQTSSCYSICIYLGQSVIAIRRMKKKGRLIKHITISYILHRFDCNRSVGAIINAEVYNILSDLFETYDLQCHHYGS